jgi:hypothetical protein
LVLRALTSASVNTGFGVADGAALDALDAAGLGCAGAVGCDSADLFRAETFEADVSRVGRVAFLAGVGLPGGVGLDMPRDSSADRAQRLNDPSGCCHTGDMIVMKIDWGDIATWVTGLFTAGSLLLGFIILRADRKRAERAEAAGVHIRSKELYEIKSARPYRVKIAIGNKSSTAMFDVRACAKPISKRRRAQKRNESDPKMEDLKRLKLEIGYPDQNAHYILQSETEKDVTLELPVGSKFYDFRIEFADINSVRWIRLVDSWKLIRYSRFRRWDMR